MELTARHKLILRAFYGKERTVHEVAKEIGVHYETLVKDVRILINEGFLRENPYRIDRKRWLTTSKFPEEMTAIPNEQAMMLWRNQLRSLRAVMSDIAPNGPESSIKLKVNDILLALAARGQLLADGETGGWTAANIRQATQKLLLEIQEWEQFIIELLKLPIWTDSPALIDRVGLDLTDEETRQKVRLQANKIQLHYMASGKRMLDAYSKE